MVKLYTVSLSEVERLLLAETARHPKGPSGLATRARILFLADEFGKREGGAQILCETVRRTLKKR